MPGSLATTLPSSCLSDHMHTERAFSSVDLRDFESILLFFSEEEIEELQAAIDERKSRRLARDGNDCPESVEQPAYPLDERGAGFQKLPTARATHYRRGGEERAVKE
jgi:hypothetical protein